MRCCRSNALVQFCTNVSAHVGASGRDAATTEGPRGSSVHAPRGSAQTRREHREFSFSDLFPTAQSRNTGRTPRGFRFRANFSTCSVRERLDTLRTPRGVLIPKKTLRSLHARASGSWEHLLVASAPFFNSQPHENDAKTASCHQLCTTSHHVNHHPDLIIPSLLRAN